MYRDIYYAKYYGMGGGGRVGGKKKKVGGKKWKREKKNGGFYFYELTLYLAINFAMYTASVCYKIYVCILFTNTNIYCEQHKSYNK